MGAKTVTGRIKTSGLYRAVLRANRRPRATMIEADKKGKRPLKYT